MYTSTRLSPGGRWRRAVASIAFAAVAATLFTPATAAAQPDEPTGYVALGDSFTAGPLIRNQLPDPPGCLRSDRNYPHVVAPQSGHDDFRDVSCSGASTRHMFNSHNVAGGPNPPQLDALDEDTALVTLGIGGNDIGFAEIIQECATLLPLGTPCQNEYVVDGHDEISARITELGPRISEVLDAIATRAPQAEVLVVGYPAIVPHAGGGCWPSLPLAWADVPYIRDKHEELNALLATQAGAHGATYVDTYTPSEGHDACTSSSQRWVEPLVPGNMAAPVHPNSRGMAGMAVAVVDNL